MVISHVGMKFRSAEKIAIEAAKQAYAELFKRASVVDDLPFDDLPFEAEPVHHHPKPKKQRHEEPMEAAIQKAKKMLSNNVSVDDILEAFSHEDYEEEFGLSRAQYMLAIKSAKMLLDWENKDNQRKQKEREAAAEAMKSEKWVKDTDGNWRLE